MSAHLAQPSTEYFVGTLNGVMYRIRPGALAPGGKMFSLEPIDGPAPALARSRQPIALRSPAVPLDRAAAPAPAPVPAAVPCPSGEVAAEAAGAPVPDTASAEREAAAATLFKRDGAEPLRAGHPDLWALLVRGTSLEGTNFRDASVA